MKQTLTSPQLSDHIERLKVQAEAIPLSLLQNKQAISCVDGRNFTGVVAAPGGNAGLFIQMLATFEIHSEQQLTREQMSSLFMGYLDRFGHFYLHSDTHALNALVQALQGQGAPIASIEQLISHISAPSGPLRSLLLEHLIQPAHTGCGHIRLMMENTETYRVRPELIQLFLQEFFHRFWTGDDRLQFDILQGDHAEQAILNIHITEKEDLDNTPLVLVAPQLQDIQVFINHPEATAYMHRQHAAFLNEQTLLNKDEIDAFTELHGGIHTSQITATVQALGAGLPVFDVVLDEALAIQKIELLGTV